MQISITKPTENSISVFENGKEIATFCDDDGFLSASNFSNELTEDQKQSITDLCLNNDNGNFII